MCIFQLRQVPIGYLRTEVNRSHKSYKVTTANEPKKPPKHSQQSTIELVFQDLKTHFSDETTVLFVLFFVLSVLFSVVLSESGLFGKKGDVLLCVCWQATVKQT